MLPEQPLQHARRFLQIGHVPLEKPVRVHDRFQFALQRVLSSAAGRIVAWLAALLQVRSAGRITAATKERAFLVFLRSTRVIAHSPLTFWLRRFSRLPVKNRGLTVKLSAALSFLHTATFPPALGLGLSRF